MGSGKVGSRDVESISSLEGDILRALFPQARGAFPDVKGTILCVLQNLWLIGNGK